MIFMPRCQRDILTPFPGFGEERRAQGAALSEPKRIQRKRAKGWRMPAGAAYVGRPGAFGNPYYITDDCQHISWFRNDLLMEAAAKGGPVSEHEWSRHFWKMARLLPTLRGKNLACWCPLDKPCHADVLLEIANRDSAQWDRNPTGEDPASGLRRVSDESPVATEGSDAPIIPRGSDD